MAKVSKVKVRVSERSWTPQDGGNTSYFVKVEMENGDKGDIMRYKTGEANVGEEFEYDIVESTKKPGEFSIKPIKKPFGGGFKGGSFAKEDNELKMVTMAYSYSKDLCVAGKIADAQVHAMAESIATKMQALTAKLKATAPKPAPDATV